MKLAKLSLAAIMTVGALSTVNAGSLEDAIKGVDFSGFARYRFNSTDDGGVTKANKNDYDLVTVFTAPVTDNIKFTAKLRAKLDDNNKNSAKNTSTLNDFGLVKAFFTYNKDALTVKAGKMALGTPVTDNGYGGTKGTGLLATYNLGSVTLAAAHFGNIEAGSDVTGKVVGNDVTAIAAIGSFGAVNAQIWGIKVGGLIDNLIFAQVDGSVVGVKLAGQVISTKLDSDIAGDDDSGLFYGFEVKYAMDNFRVGASYSKNDKDMAYHGVDADTDTDVITAGWKLTDSFQDQTLQADVSAYGINAGMTFGKISVDAGYAVATDADTVNANEKGDLKEAWGKVGYKYAKNFKTFVGYSDISSDGALEQQFFRFEAKYSF